MPDDSLARITSEEDIPSSTLLSYMMAILVKVLQFERVLKKRSSSSHFQKEGRGKAKGLGEKKASRRPKNNNHHFYSSTAAVVLLCIPNCLHIVGLIIFTHYESIIKSIFLKKKLKDSLKLS